MTRSAKKGPYVDHNLEEKVLKMNQRNEKRVIKSVGARQHPHP